MKKSKGKTALDRHGESLSVEDFFDFLREIDACYITSATVYFPDGTEMKTSLDKKNKKWLELKAKWKSK